MDKFLKRKFICDEEQSHEQSNKQPDVLNISKKKIIEINIDDLPADPGLRSKMSDYHPNEQDKVRRAYLQKGPCQPLQHNFPQTKIGNISRRFCPSWFNEYKNWLEYSVEKDAAFCLCCYLFRPDFGKQGSGDAFVTEGFTSWNKKNRFQKHIGGPNSAHNQALKKCENLMKQKQHIEVALSRQSDLARSLYRSRLTASIDCIRFLLCQGLAFRGHDESERSNNQGNFLELLKFLADHNEDIKRNVLQNAPENHQLIAPDIQKDIVHAAAVETTNAIIEELGNELFAIIVDESRDASDKEQMAVALRYVNKEGMIVERFLGIVHVNDTSALSLKIAIESLLIKHGLSICRIRGQGYDGASNMRGEFNGLKTLISKENPVAFYVHCFAHQLQLTLVAVAKNHIQIASFFNEVATLLNVVGGSCKRHDMLLESRIIKVREALGRGEILSGRGLNQELSLKRPADTRWGSHYGTLLNIINMYSSIIEVIEFIVEDGSTSEKKAEANGLLDLIQTFDFVFSMHLMRSILGVTNELSTTLQRKDQDIVNGMRQVKISKQRLQIMRNSGWENLLKEVCLFCNSQSIEIPQMNVVRVLRGRPSRKTAEITNLHYYQVDLFYNVIDMQFQELNDRFTETTTELLLCMECLNPANNFIIFDKIKLLKLAQFYPSDFSSIDILTLDNQLENYIFDMRTSSDFSDLKGISTLAEKLVKTNRSIVYPLVYSLLKLTMILPVATATVERAFSAMNIVKGRLRNKMGDIWMNDCLITYIERDIFNTVDNELILQRFPNMKTRRGQL